VHACPTCQSDRVIRNGSAAARPRQAFSHHDMARVIHPYNRKNSLCQVNPSYARILFYGTHLLLCGMISPTLKSFWLMEVVVQRQVHYITTAMSPGRGHHEA
jgi:hypothetical protein